MGLRVVPDTHGRPIRDNGISFWGKASAREAEGSGSEHSRLCPIMGRKRTSHVRFWGHSSCPQMNKAGFTRSRLA